ncbi:MAG: AI-2E family transporter [Myxococcota bacterium]
MSNDSDSSTTSLTLSREQGLLITGSLVLIAGVTLSFALWYAKNVLIPLALALLVSYLVGPLVNTLQVRFSLPRWAAILLAFVAIAGVGTLLGFAVVGSVNQLLEDGEIFQSGLRKFIDDATAFVEPYLSQVVPIEEGATRPNDILQQIVQWLPSGLSIGSDAIGLVSQLVINGVLVLLFAVILMAGRSPSDSRTGLWGEIDRNIQRYLATKFFASAVTGILTWILLALLGIKLSLVFGLLAFFLNFIPSAGSIIAMVLPLPVAYLSHPESPWIWVLALLLPGSVQFLIGNIIEPRLQGDRLDLHIITVLATLLFWTLLWNIPGAILAVPMTVVVKMVLARFETTRPVAELLAGRLPDTTSTST